MEIRKATANDYKKIVSAISRKHLDYLTAEHIRADIKFGRELVAVENNKIIATVSVVYDKDFNYYAIKRLCIPNKKNLGRGIAQQMILAAMQNCNGKIGCTPWIDNDAMRYILENLGFKLEYIFDEKWCFYSKE